ncbi:conserved hypothetical protein [Ricinus communis]|uniref:Uncharacterized protein n=1 Tax=Ricinus communis TaxID=3988 RepID=B9STS0_RICCO|nr:conserved hypothetical protein [Ricinus communis]
MTIKTVVTEIDPCQEREITQLRKDAAVEIHVREIQSSNSVVMDSTACDTKPVAERRGSGPITCYERIRYKPLMIAQLAVPR